MNKFSFLSVVSLLILSFFFWGIVNATPVSLRDKIGQMLIIGFDGAEVDINSPIVKTIQKNNIGGVILFDYNLKTNHFDKNIESPAQVRQLTYDLQDANQMAQIKYHRDILPLFISVDYEGGERGTRLKPMKGFPETVNAATVGQMTHEQASIVAETMALTLQQVGLNLNFSPVMDVNINPDSPIIGKLGRSFSSNPSDVAKFSSLYSQHHLDHKVQCAYKHFPGHGSATGDSHLGFVDVTETWQAQELEPYKQLLGSSQTCGMIMTAHIVNRQLDESGLPATLSRKIITELLRNKLNFNGVVITDDMQMKAISDQGKIV